jgi:hypothetical protein
MTKAQLAFAVALTCYASMADAHLRLDSPTARTASLKAGPCGVTGSTRGSNVTVLAPGATIDVKWTETINHPGHYRISFDANGQNFTVPPDFNDFSLTTNVLVDNIPDRSGLMLTYSKTITLPNIQCENCTLQVIQMMTDKPPYGDGNDVYYQCADIALRAGAPTPDAPGPTSDAGATPDAGGGSSKSGGCASHHGELGIIAVALVAFGLLRNRRRRCCT